MGQLICVGEASYQLDQFSFCYTLPKSATCGFYDEKPLEDLLLRGISEGELL